MDLARKPMDSPVGTLELVASDRGLVAVLWQDDRPGRVPVGEARHAPDHLVLREAEKQLSEYFSGLRTIFNLPLDLRGTAFQQQVWHALCEIPYGETRTYGELARQLGNPQGMRAVGAANGKNPVSIIVPCHRVIGGTGKLTGFAGGLDVKARLLILEQEHQPFQLR